MRVIIVLNEICACMFTRAPSIKVEKINKCKRFREFPVMYF